MSNGELARRVLKLCLAWLLTGCHVPAARVTSTHAGANVLPCTVVFARQIAADSAIEMAFFPWRASQTAVFEPARDLCALGKGAFGKRLMMPIAGPPENIDAQRRPMDIHVIDRHLDEVLSNKVLPASVQLYTGGTDALTALKNLIHSAERSIDVLMFQWENDTMGAEIAGWLAAKASPNLRIRILVDGGGNLVFGHATRSHPADVNGVVALLAQKPYVELIRTRNPFGRVDHRKLVLVDDRIAWTGGRNFTHQSFFDQRDVSFTVEGPLSAALAHEFEDFWREQGGDARLLNEQATVDNTPRGANARARWLATGPMRRDIEQALYHVVDQSQHHVFLENYTFSDSCLVYKLAQARQRGVDVRVVLTFSDCTNALNRANRVIANRLFEAGVRVYVYPGLMHAKAAVVDSSWAYLGTGNFDPLSLRRNLELGIALSDCPLVQTIESDLFARDFRPEWELTQSLPLTAKDYAYELLASLCL